MKKAKCVVCGNNTSYIVAINFSKVFLCDICATDIMLQQAKWLSRRTDREGRGGENG